MSEVINGERAAEDVKLPWWRNEDWIAGGLGLLVIALVLCGVRPTLPRYGWGGVGDLAGGVLGPGNLMKVLLVGLGTLAVASVGVALAGANVIRFAVGFAALFALSILSLVLAGNSGVSYWGIEYVIFAVLVGILISNTLGVPGWLAEAVRTEFYIKTGLVILGAGILIQEILQAGLLGILQALGVVAVVWYACFWLAKRLKVDDEFAVMLSTAVSICGVSAAIAACGAIKGDRRKLSYVTSLVLIVAVPMIVFLPWIIRQFSIPELVGGAWLGGTLDTSGSVVAAGALVGERALKVGTIVKFSQNVLIGLAAFLLSLWWAYRGKGRGGDGPGLSVIWERFPKFVLGFVAASLAFSFLLSPGLVQETKGLLAGLRTVWFALAFTSIGLETRFNELVRMEGGRPALAFVGAQAVNVVWTLLLAFLLFGGVLFSPPEIK